MPFSSGTFTLYSPGNPVVEGTDIEADWWTNTGNDLASGLSTCVLKDGSQTITANIPMSSFKFTGLALGTALTDSARLSQVQNQAGSNLTNVAGTNTVTATATPTPAYAVGQRFTFVPAVTNTGAVTLNISSVGAGAVQLLGAALTGGELVANLPVTVLVTATTPVFEIIQPTQFPDSRALVVGATDATKKIRFEADELTTASTRVITMADQDIDLGTTQSEADAGTAGKVLIAALNKLSIPGAAVASTSGTSIDFTGIPAGVRRVTFSLSGVSSSGTSPYLLQIGDTDGIEATGYVSSAFNITTQSDYTAGFGLMTAAVAAITYHGSIVLTLVDAATFTWAASGGLSAAGSGNGFCISGSKALSATLDRVRLTTSGGSDTFDAGLVNIIYER